MPNLKLVGYSQRPLDAVRNFTANKLYPDLTFIDIDMPELSGVELAGILKGKTNIVFTTAYSNFGPQAYDLGVKDYLLKPISYSRFFKCITDISAQYKKNKVPEKTNDYFYIQTEGKGKHVKLLYSSILYIESQKNYISIITKEKSYLTYLTLAEIEEKLSPSFIRVHKSFIVNTDKINQIEGNDLVLQDVNISLTISNGYKEKFIEFVNTHVIRSKRFPH